MTVHSVGINSQEGVIGKTFADMKLQRGEEAVQPSQMLNRILLISDSATDLATYMKYEFVPSPLSLFDDMPMRRPAHHHRHHQALRASLSAL